MEEKNFEAGMEEPEVADNDNEKSLSAKEVREVAGRMDFLLRNADNLLSAESPEGQSGGREKINIWRAASAMGEARALINSDNGKIVCGQNPHFFDPYERIYEVVMDAIGNMPGDDPTAIISRWRLEKPLEPVVPDLSEAERRRANTPCGKSIYEFPAGAETGSDQEKEDELNHARNVFASKLEEKSPEHAQAYRIAVDFARKVKEAGGRVLFVGGSIRDIRSGIIPKDFDVEVYGIDSAKIDEVAMQFGPVDGVGAAFAVKKLHLGGGKDIDISQPRVDSQNRPEHNSTQSKPVIDLPIREACRRRDFTINSMAADVLTGELFDFFGGDKDLQGGILRVTDERMFCDDPLRVMRAMQFVGRLGLSVDARTAEIMRLMVFELDRVAKDRFKEEWSKLLLKSNMPSLGLIKGMELGVFEYLYPELSGLFGVKQSAEWHPEGNAGIHTLMVSDEAAKIVKRERLAGDEAFAIMLAAVCHDFGKISKTQEDADGKITSIGHEAAGVIPAKIFLEKIGLPLQMIKKTLKLVENHMAPPLLYASNISGAGEVSDGAIRKLAARLGNDATIEELVLLAEADNLGRGYDGDNEMIEGFLQMDGFPAGPWLLDRARALNVEKEKPKPLLRGDMILKFGFKPGPVIGQISSLADRLRDEKGFSRQRVIVEIYRSVAENGSGETSKIIAHLESLLK